MKTCELSLLSLALCLLCLPLHTVSEPEPPRAHPAAEPSPSGGASGEFQLGGPNVCIDQKEVTTTINITQYQSQKVKTYTWCLKVPPRCPKWTQKIVQK